jgi:hypothetical protein
MLSISSDIVFNVRYLVLAFLTRDDTDDIHFVLVQHVYLELYSVTSLKQQSMSVHVGTLS